MKRIYFIICAVILTAGCSTTKRLAEGEILYTGVRKIDVRSTVGDDVLPEVESAVREVLSVRPNNPLFSPYVRTPFPIGLWAYNAFYTERQTGIRAWIFRNFAKAPVLISDVQPGLRVGSVRNILENHGYFAADAEYEIIPSRRRKRARISYRVDVPPAWFYSNVEFPAAHDPVTYAIDSLQSSSWIRVGERFDIDSLTNERIRITNVLRNGSYYFFRPDYLEYIADSTQQRFNVDLRMMMAAGIPEAALRPYSIGNINIQIYNIAEEGPMMFDTLPNGTVIWYQEPLRVRPKIFQRTIAISSGEPARVDDINATLTNLTRMGIFRFVNMTVTPLELIKPDAESLDMTISMAMDTPMDAELEFDFSQKSSNFIGPKAAFGVRHKNFFRAGEIFSVKVNGGYEWQTGSKIGDIRINSYEVGINASLIFPRLVAPGFIRRNRYDTRTSYRIGADLLNRPRFFRMMSISGSISYNFQTSPTSFHELTPFRLTYNRMLSKTEEFNQKLEESRALEQSFADQFIPSASYTYTWDKRVGRGARDRFVWQVSGMSAGNAFAAIYSLFGSSGTKQLFGIQFSQFVKLTNEFKYFRRLGESTLATRLLVGAARAYGNSGYLDLPFSEQFAIGGANSIRAFTIRSVGPGSFRSDNDAYGYFDQTGDFKLEANVELRFPIFGDLNGAVFLDAGNIWMLRGDPERPGSKLEARNFFGDIAIGTGFGLRYDLGFLVIRADLGIGLHLPFETDRNGYFNAFRTKEGRQLHLAIGYPF